MAEHGRVRQEERYAEKIRSKKRCSAMCRQTSEYLRIIPCQARVLQQAASALIAVSNAFTCCAALSRSAFNCAIMSKSPPGARIVAERVQLNPIPDPVPVAVRYSLRNFW